MDFDRSLQRLALFVLTFAMMIGDVSAQQDISGMPDYGQSLKITNTIQPKDETPFGENINLYTGEVTFHHPDVVLAGTGPTITLARDRIGPRTSLDVNGETVQPYAFGDWSLSVPRIETIGGSGWTVEPAGHPLSDARCSHMKEPVASSGIGVPWWFGIELITETGQRQQVLVRSPQNTLKPTMKDAQGVLTQFPVVTAENWQISCLANISNEGPGKSGEAFLAVAPDGTKYRFDYLDYDLASTVTEMDGGVVIRQRRSLATMYVSRIEDRFGNWLKYEYDEDKLVKISANDGRLVTIAWRTDKRLVDKITVQPVSDQPRVWSYVYGTLAGYLPVLSQVVLPDLTRWTFSLHQPIGRVLTDTRKCNVRGPLPVSSTPTVLSVTSPTGLKGTFTHMQTWHAHSYMSSSCRHMPNMDPFEERSPLYEVWSLKKQEISGPGVPLRTWTYTYAPGIGSTTADPCAASTTCADTKWVDVTDPGLNRTRYTHSNRDGELDGQLIKVERYQGASTLLRSEAYAYATASQGPWPSLLGDPMTPVARRALAWMPLKAKIVTQQGAEFRWQAKKFDTYANVLGITRSSSLNAAYVRSDYTEYEQNLGHWVLGQVKRVTLSADGTSPGAVAMQESVYDPTTALPIRSYAFGKLQQTLTYNADGSLATVKDGNNNVTILSSWKRGIPQLIQFPATPDQPSGAAKSAVVNDNGWISSMTDENGFTTNYSYDTMGRLASIAYPTGDSTAWTTTTLNFAPSASPVYGLPAGHWRQTIQTGNARTVTMFDALWRPVVKETYDAANLNGTLAQTVTRYDANGRTAFVSFPQRNLDPAVYTTWADPSRAPNALGTRMDYDALNRVTAVKQDSELGMLTSTTQYLAGFQTRTTNPRGQSTTTRYLALDQPTDDLPVAIAAPEGTYTDIVRDVFGKPTAITRRNANNTLALTRYWMYDAAQQLCKTVEPETGTSLFDYDAAGNLIRQTIGIPFTYPSPCASAGLQAPNSSPPSQAPDIRRSYDARNRVKTLVFPDGRGDTTYVYTPDSLPASITTNNAPGGEQVINTYAYNRRRMMTGESMTQSGWYSWGIGYGYDGIGNLSTQTYPDGSTVFYAPNALGQATQVKDHSNYVFASGAQYYPNGALMQLTYGNGLTHVMTQNVRQLPQRSTDSGGVLDHEYVYDPNANVQYIYDQRNPADHRYLYYDGLDRLTSAGSQMFGGDHWHRFTYDVLDNLKSWKLAGVKDYANYYYDANNRLTNIQNSAGASVVGLSYDPQGNLSNKNGQNYAFNYGNWLREVTGKEYFRYDGHGRRIMAWSPTLGSIFSQYTSDGKLFYQEDQRSGNKRLYHLFLGGNLVAIREVSTAAGLVTRYQHTDALGSPVAVSNEVGVVVERNNYEPYGAIIGKPNYGGVGFTGHAQDAATGLTYMQQRYYDPQLGRFLSVDPVTANSGTGANFNRYWYANNNPYKFTDPDGRQAKELGRWARALWDNDGDFKKAEAQVDKQHQMDLKVANTIVDFTAAGVVKDAIEVTTKVANGKDATGQGAGAVVGEVAGQVTEAILDGKIGGGAASAVGAAVGKATGDTVERVVDNSRSGSSNSPNAPSATPKPEPPQIRDKVGDK